ncbi:exopolysaccharide biosynthesis protein [Brumicola blandensis]|uniref:Exopolysaccharide biosynthesis protein n=1 Tax=Brumicola blandensis TaxID=3075611 RepID=A0AAW8QWI9_9ALTE|nr:exopolysaccharide biosynthesis protein [Alteromonas sp. W409]MDT0581508.1 exopolysaccharide biosynthesis protein [Alteromonas sp. W409]
MQPIITPVETISQKFTRIIHSIEGDDITINSLLLELQKRSFGGVFLLLAVVSIIPAINTITGLMIVVVGIQMALQYPAPYIFSSLRKRTVQKETLEQAFKVISRVLEKTERHAKPRLTYIFKPFLLSVLGIAIAALAIFITLPIPFTNFLPIVCITILSIGLLEKDGLWVLVGLGFTLLTMIICVVIIVVLLQSLTLF